MARMLARLAARATGTMIFLLWAPSLSLVGCGGTTSFSPENAGAAQPSGSATRSASSADGTPSGSGDATAAAAAGSDGSGATSAAGAASASNTPAGSSATAGAPAASGAGGDGGAAATSAGNGANDTANAGGAGGSGGSGAGKSGTGSASASNSPSGGAGSTAGSGGAASGSGAGGSSGGSASTGNSGGNSSGGSSGSTAALPPGVPCSEDYSIPATSNPYLAGEPSGTTIDYSKYVTDNSNPIDEAPSEAPVLVVPSGDSCLKMGTVLTFSVSGTITYNASVTGTNANGDLSQITSHSLGSYYGKSSITAPINSLLGVFLTDAAPTLATAPSALDFSTQAERDYVSLAPQIGQVFYIGTGLTSTGASHQVTVPAGATRLYFAVMDGYQWNNNAGTLTGAILGH